MIYIDPVAVSPKNYKTLLENEQVRVLEMSPRKVGLFIFKHPLKLSRPPGRGAGTQDCSGSQPRYGS